MEVGLFILAERTITTPGRITADTTLRTADTTLLTADLASTDSTYVNTIRANKIDLFDDEKITVNSSVQDISDISKIFTDFSQSFTVPASKNNNAVFKYWYESAIDNGFDARIRKDAYIELNNTPFRRGKIQIEKANIKNNKIESYTITFFGSLLSLKDAFNNRFLKDLDYSDLDFDYQAEIIKDKIIGNVNDDVKFPLITSLNNWQYDTGGNTNLNWDIKNSVSPINTNDLFPAVRVSKIFEAIENDLGIEFQGDFLTNLRFTRAFLWLKNKDTFEVISSRNLLQFDEFTSDINYYNFDLSTFTFNWEGFTVPTEFIEDSILNIEASGVPPDTLVTLFVYKDGNLLYSLPNRVFVDGNNTYLDLPISGGTGGYQFFISANKNFNFYSEYTFNTKNTAGAFIKKMKVVFTTTQSLTSKIEISNYMPEIKIEDFFSGILKMFNLTCYSDTAGIFRIEQLETWYNDGDIIDITQFVDYQNIDVERVKPFNKINFNYEKSESITNQAFLGNSTTGYGDLIFETGYDGGNYEVKVPFENLLFSQLKDTNIIVGYALKPDLTRYQPKPVILYDYGVLQTSSLFYLKYDAVNTQYNTYNLFGSETIIDDVRYSLNFGAENSVKDGDVLNNSLFNTYYQKYIENIFSQKARVLKIKTKLPVYVITNLKLNNRIIIRDKRYIINNFTTDLTTGEVNFELLTDFRDI